MASMGRWRTAFGSAAPLVAGGLTPSGWTTFVGGGTGVMGTSVAGASFAPLRATPPLISASSPLPNAFFVMVEIPPPSGPLFIGKTAACRAESMVDGRRSPFVLARFWQTCFYRNSCRTIHPNHRSACHDYAKRHFGGHQDRKST